MLTCSYVIVLRVLFMSKEETAAGRHSHPVIGILAGSFHSDFSRTIVTAITKRLQARGAEIHLYLGMDVARYLEGYSEQEDALSLQYFSLFSYSNFDDADVLIISSDTIYAAEYGIELHDFLRSLPNVPKIVIGENIENDREIGIMIDQFYGVKTMVDHLIEVHGCRRIGFLTGPKNIPNALTRLSAYRASLEEHGIEFDEELVEYGNFTSLCDRQAERLLGRKLEAVAAANDEMTVALYRAAKKFGLKIGEDLLITGYDDIPVAGIMEPPLTTMRQDYDGVADAAVNRAYEFIEKGQASPKIIKPTRIIRCSCGCNGGVRQLPKIEEKNAEEEFTSYEELKMREVREMKATLLLRSLLVTPVTLKDFLLRLSRGLSIIGVEESMFTLLDEPTVMKRNHKGFILDRQRIVMIQKPDGGDVYDLKDAPCLYADRGSERTGTRKHIPHVFPGKIWSTYILFHDNIQYGSWSVKLELSDFMYYYTVSLEMGSALRYLFLALEQQKTQEKLEQQNLILDYSASHDMLTGLLNRTGVIRKIAEYIEERPFGSRFAAVMFDLDHLKQINDTFGHVEGDYAIRAAADIALWSLPEGAPIGRTGGDEFMGLFNVEEDFDEEEFKASIKKFCAEENETNGKLYYVDISMGCYVFTRQKNTSPMDCFKEADMKLYEAKKSRRENIVRGEKA